MIGFYFLIAALIGVAMYTVYSVFFKGNTEQIDPIQYSVGTPIVKSELRSDGSPMPEEGRNEVFTSNIASRKEALEWWMKCTTGEKRVSMYDAQFADKKIHELSRFEIDVIYQIHNELKLV